MAKCTKKNRNNSVRLKQRAASKQDVMYDDEKDEDLKEIDENICSEDEVEEYGEDERKRQKLLEAISALGGKRKKRLEERSEAAVQMSEFTVNAQEKADQIDMSELIATMEKTPAVTAATKKQLKNLQQGTRTIESPISKQESEKIQRDVAFQKAAANVSRWKGVIKQTQKAEQLVFPLNQESSALKPIERVVTGWKAQTPLEQEVFALLSANNQPIIDPILTSAEEASLKAMSLEEAKIRRAELQKARALQSYYEAKARRERKIKSKKYHKVHNKNKGKDYLKQFEELVKTDAPAALEELNKMELARMQERMSLKHQNSGKWAKSKAIMAKYDDSARKAMQQQLELNKELTQKLVMLNKEEEEVEDANEADIVPDFVNDAEQVLDSSNPWMRGKLSLDPTTEEIIVDVKAGEAEATADLAEEEAEIEETEEETLLREFHSRRKIHQETDKAPAIIPPFEEGYEAAAEILDVSDKEEEELSEFTSILKGITQSYQDAEPAAEASLSETHLKEGLVHIQSVDDLNLFGLEKSAREKSPVQPHPPPPTHKITPSNEKAVKNRKRKKGIELAKVLTRETNFIQVPLTPTVEDKEDCIEKTDQRGLIKEAFAGDDVVSDFLKEKKKQEEAGKSKIIDLTLPGWGEWGGLGLKPSRNKRKRFRSKTEPPPPRKDQHLPSIIISEARNSSITRHQVNSLPFPFETNLQFESTIRMPLGRTWNTEHTVRKLTKPKVVTQLGAIIEPMAQEELIKDKKEASFTSERSVDLKKNIRKK